MKSNVQLENDKIQVETPVLARVATQLNVKDIDTETVQRIFQEIPPDSPETSDSSSRTVSEKNSLENLKENSRESSPKEISPEKSLRKEKKLSEMQLIERMSSNIGPIDLKDFRPHSTANIELRDRVSFKLNIQVETFKLNSSWNLREIAKFFSTIVGCSLQFGIQRKQFGGNSQSVERMRTWWGSDGRHGISDRDTRSSKTKKQ